MYCVKCRSKKTGKDVKEITLQNGRKALQGTCETCNTKMIKLGIAQK